MRLAGFLLLCSGWLLIVAAIGMLRASAQSAFVLTGFLVQVAGLVMVFRTHLIPHGDKR